jgi:hypothetical protein
VINLLIVCWPWGFITRHCGCFVAVSQTVGSMQHSTWCDSHLLVAALTFDCMTGFCHVTRQCVVRHGDDVRERKNEWLALVLPYWYVQCGRSLRNDVEIPPLGVSRVFSVFHPALGWLDCVLYSLVVYVISLAKLPAVRSTAFSLYPWNKYKRLQVMPLASTTSSYKYP